MSDKYLDTNLSTDEKDLEHIISKLVHLETNDLISWIDAIIPKWKITQTKRYASEYDVLEQNWINLCQKWNAKPHFIIIVDFIPPQNDANNYKIIWTLCNYLTKEGNVIRNQSELTTCLNCNSAILTKTVIERINKARSSVKDPPPSKIPTIWNHLCNACNSIA